MNKKNLLKFISAWQIEIMSSVIVILCLFLVYLFPVQNSFQNFSRNLFFLFLLPLLYIKLVLKKNIRDYGFSLQNKKTGFAWAAGMLIVSCLIVFLLIHFFQFETKYFLRAYLAQSFWIFLFYELVLVNFLLFINEFFFKGFLLFIFAEKLGHWAIAIQFLAYLLFLIFASSLAWQIAPMIILALTGGIVTYKSKSFIYSYLMGLVFLIILDSYIIYIFK